LGKNFKAKTKQRNQAIDSIITLLDSECPILNFKFEGGIKSESQLKQDIYPLVQAIGLNESLASIDISGHQMGNKGAMLLGKSLQTNVMLKHINWAENLTTLQGFTGIKLALERNNTLINMSIPILDVSAALKTDDPKLLVKTISDIEAAIYRNLEFQMKPSQPQQTANAKR